MKYAELNPEQRVGGSGFTLIEIGVVVGVIGVILMIAVPAFLGARNKSLEREARCEVELIGVAVEELAWDTGQWPGGIKRNIQGDKELWDLTEQKAGLFVNDGRFDNWQGSYIKDLPLDPWGNPYFFDPDYNIDGKMRAVVGSFGPNGRGRNVYDADNIYVVLD